LTQATLRVCTNFRFGLTSPSCGGCGGDRLVGALRQEIAKRGLAWAVAEARCLGYCSQGPNLKAHGGPLLHHCLPDTATAIIDRLLVEWHPDTGTGLAEPDEAAWPLPGL